MLRQNQKFGIALLAVVVVVALLATAALTFALLMQQSNQTARSFGDQQQSQWALESGVAMMLGAAALAPEQRETWATSNAAIFVQSLELLAAAGDSGGLGSLGGPEDDWTTSAADSEFTPTADWQEMLSGSQIEFDHTQPGFVIFDWFDGDKPQGSLQPGSNPVGPFGSSTFGGASYGAVASSPFSASESNGQNLQLRFGWTNESSKLHLARLLEWEARGAPVASILQTWCGLNSQQADQILDWLDRDDNSRPFGAEQAEYANQGLSYRSLNQVPTSLDTLLLVPSISPQLLYGRRQSTFIQIEDLELASASQTTGSGLAEFTRSQQNQIEQDLQGADSLSNEAARNLVFELGLCQRLTVTAKQRLVNRMGQPQIPVNHRDLQKLFTAMSTRLDPPLATYICLVRQFGVQPGTISSFNNTSTELLLDDVEIDFNQQAAQQLSSLVQLVDSHVLIPGPAGTNQIVNSPLNAIGSDSEFAAQVARVFDQLTVSSAGVSVGKIHWKQADPQLLILVPGLTPETIQLLRDSASSSVEVAPSGGATAGGLVGDSLAYQAALWYQENRLPLEQWQVIERELTVGGDVYSAYIFAHGGDYRSIRWAHVIVDASEKRPQQVYYRELLPPPPTLQAILAILDENAAATP